MKIILLCIVTNQEYVKLCNKLFLKLLFNYVHLGFIKC